MLGVDEVVTEGYKAGLERLLPTRGQAVVVVVVVVVGFGLETCDQRGSVLSHFGGKSKSIRLPCGRRGASCALLLYSKGPGWGAKKVLGARD